MSIESYPFYAPNGFLSVSGRFDSNGKAQVSLPPIDSFTGYDWAHYHTGGSNIGPPFGIPVGVQLGASCPGYWVGVNIGSGTGVNFGGASATLASLSTVGSVTHNKFNCVYGANPIAFISACDNAGNAAANVAFTYQFTLTCDIYLPPDSVVSDSCTPLFRWGDTPTLNNPPTLTAPSGLTAVWQKIFGGLGVHLSWTNNDSHATGTAIERYNVVTQTWDLIAAVPTGLSSHLPGGDLHTYDDFGSSSIAIPRGIMQYRVYSFAQANFTKSDYSNTATIPFNIQKIIPNSTIINLPRPQITIYGVGNSNGYGTPDLTQVSTVRFISRFDNSKYVDVTSISPDTANTIKLTVPDPPNGIEPVDVQLRTIFGNNRATPTLQAGFSYHELIQWTLENPSTPVKAGDSVTVSSPTKDGLNFQNVQTASITYTDKNGAPITLNISSTYWTTQTQTLFIFTLPSNITNDTPAQITILITSTDFSGSVELGKLYTIYFVNAPGIYTLTPGKTSDTLYNPIDGGTIDVKIPNPFGKTGFVGG